MMLSRLLKATTDPAKVKESVEIESPAKEILLRDTDEMRQHRQQIGDSWLRTE